MTFARNFTPRRNWVRSSRKLRVRLQGGIVIKRNRVPTIDATDADVSLSLSLSLHAIFFLLHDAPWAEHYVADEREAQRAADRFAWIIVQRPILPTRLDRFLSLSFCSRWIAIIPWAARRRKKREPLRLNHRRAGLVEATEVLPSKARVLLFSNSRGDAELSTNRDGFRSNSSKPDSSACLLAL